MVLASLSRDSLAKALLFTLLLCICLVKNSIAAQHSYSIHHDLGKGFHPRGTSILISNGPSGLTSQVENDEECTTDTSENDILFQKLISEAKMYKLKMIDESTKREAITSVPACSLLRSYFREEISLVLGTNGELLSISHVPQISPLAPKICSAEDVPTNTTFTTTVSFLTSTPAMVIPVILPSQRSRPAGLKFFPSTGNAMPGVEGSEQPNVSFMRKYWYIFLPMVIVSLIGGGEEAPAQQTGGEQRADLGLASASGVAAGAAVGAAGAKARRSKRS